jgi:hypothetical protein
MKQFPSDGRQGPERKKNGKQKKNIFSCSSRNRFLLMEDRAQRERRVEIRRGTYSVVSHGTVSF